MKKKPIIKTRAGEIIQYDPNDFSWGSPHWWGNTPWGVSDTGIYRTTELKWNYRRVIWRDVKNSLRNLWTTMKDYLLTRSRSFFENADSVSFSTSSANGCTVKLHPSSSGTTRKTATSQLQESTNTTSSAGSTPKRKGRRSYGTKSPEDQFEYIDRVGFGKPKRMRPSSGTNCICGVPSRAYWSHGPKRCRSQKRRKKGRK